MFSDEDREFVELLMSLDRVQLNMIKGFAAALVFNSYDYPQEENSQVTKQHIEGGNEV